MNHLYTGRFLRTIGGWLVSICLRWLYCENGRSHSFRVRLKLAITRHSPPMSGFFKRFLNR